MTAAENDAPACDEWDGCQASCYVDDIKVCDCTDDECDEVGAPGCYFGSVPPPSSDGAR